MVTSSTAVAVVDALDDDEDAYCKSYKTRHRRGKSETLRAQYINTKEVRVIVGTWNVAGRAPNEDLDIDDWLCTEDPADIYILGFGKSSTDNPELSVELLFH